MQKDAEDTLRRRLEGAAAYDAKPEGAVEFDGDLARVARVIDGDTLSLLYFERGELRLRTLRVAGVDAPELHGRGPAERRCAEAVRAAVERLVLDRIVCVRLEGTDKYGRLLGDVALPDVAGQADTLAARLLARGLARPYNGHGARLPFAEAELAAVMRATENEGA